ncbi:MAG: hypothetical protein HQM10_25450 [Candidatus Riflebacteria bacterium]|nr:hypothetical protein [Candidatus Riflebacteria bacterium]
MLKYLSIGIVLLCLVLLPAAMTGCGTDDISSVKSYATVGPGNADAEYLNKHNSTSTYTSTQTSIR